MAVVTTSACTNDLTQLGQRVAVVENANPISLLEGQEITSVEIERLIMRGGSIVYDRDRKIVLTDAGPANSNIRGGANCQLDRVEVATLINALGQAAQSEIPPSTEPAFIIRIHTTDTPDFVVSIPKYIYSQSFVIITVNGMPLSLVPREQDIVVSSIVSAGCG